MKEKNPLERLLNEVGDMLKLVQEHKGEINQNLTPEFFLQLEKLEQTVDIFNEINNEVYKAANIDLEALTKQALKSPDLSDRDKTMFARAKQIEKDARTLKLKNAWVTSMSKSVPKPTKDKEVEKKNIKERRKRFKSRGQERGWIPL